METFFYLYGIIQIGFIISTIIKPPFKGIKKNPIEIIKWMPENIGKTFLFFLAMIYYIGGLFTDFWFLFLTIFLESLVGNLMGIPQKYSNIFQILIIIFIVISAILNFDYGIQ